jgi:hypothetical protein
VAAPSIACAAARVKNDLHSTRLRVGLWMRSWAAYRKNIFFDGYRRLWAWGRGDVGKVDSRYECQHRCKLCVGVGLLVL